jgi:hypothetical protein
MNQKPTDGSVHRPKVLIGICSCVAYSDKRAACRETWLSKPADGVKAWFFVGGGEPLPDEPDTVVLNSPDTYNELPRKVLDFFRYALAHDDFEWLFKCDDDTYVVQERLAKLAALRPDFAGNAHFIQRHGYASGGAGYLLSRHFVELLANDTTLPDSGPEDIILTKRVLAAGAVAFPTALLEWSRNPLPRPDNEMITCHWCLPQHHRAVHTRLYETVVAEYAVTHRQWQDRLSVYANGLFGRHSSECSGEWHRDAAGDLHLRWSDWPVEKLRAVGTGFASEVMTMVAYAAPVVGRGERVLVLRLTGGMGNQMFQYAYGLWVARQCEATLHLSYADHARSFALGTFGLQLSAEPPERTPWLLDESGYSPGMETRLLEAVKLLMRPCLTLAGYFQNEAYFLPIADEVRVQFQLPARAVAVAAGKTVVCVHVRRGDFATSPIHQVCSPAYYEAAMQQMREWVADPVFMVVSDDPPWCEGLMSHWPDVTVLPPMDEVEALRTMYACSAFVLSNSTFGWWAAWMTEAQYVIRPDRFLSGQDWDIGPERWTAFETGG